MIGLLLRLYPSGWRARYGDEFAVMLGERALGPFDVVDVLLGALDAHLNLRGLQAVSEQRKGIAMTLRIGGIAAIIGGPLWVASLVGGSLTAGPVPWLLLALIATALLLLAFVGLSAFQARSHPVLVWLAFAIPALGALISILGLFGMIFVGERRFVLDYSPWYVWMIGTITMFAGSALFATATWTSKALSRAGAGLIGLSSFALLPILGFWGNVSGPAAIVPLLAGFVAFAAGWAMLGASAIRIDRPGSKTLRGASA